jgi:HAD superfamily hydrolase (TIGR01509 family)
VIRALVFDFDGLILDTEDAEYRSWLEVYSEHGVELPLERWVSCIGTDNSAFDPYLHLTSLVADPIDWTEVRERRRRRQLELLAGVPPLPGVADYLARAGALGLKVGVASSSSRRWVTGHLGQLGLAPLVHAVKCADDVTRVKPDPELYLASTEALGVSPAQAVALEDSPNGIAAAKAAGLRCVAVPNPLTRGLPLGAADLVLESLAAMSLDDLLRRLGSGSRPG